MTRYSCQCAATATGDSWCVFMLPQGVCDEVRLHSYILYTGTGSQEQDSTISRPFGKLHTQCTTKGSDQLDHKQAKVHHDRVETD